MSDKRRKNMTRLHGDPVFRSARDERAQERFRDPTENKRLQRLSNIAKRGCDVPEGLEAEWDALKRIKLTNREAAAMLRIPWTGDPEDAPDASMAADKLCHMIDVLIALIEQEPSLNPDFAYRAIEQCKKMKSLFYPR